MFLEIKYTRWYRDLIAKAKIRVCVAEAYYENHHILPRSLGGDDSAENLVPLTAKEHFVAHHLLTKMCIERKHTNSMWNAFFLMHIHSTSNRHRTSRTYAYTKERMAETKRGTMMGTDNPFYGQKHTEETKAKMRLKRTGRVCRRDWTVYDFHHEDHGLIKSTRYDLCQSFGVNHKSVHSIATGYTKTHKGWRCLNPEKPKTPYSK